MRRTFLPVALTAVLLATVVLPGCNKLTLGNVNNQKIQLSGFTRVEVEGNFKVDIAQAENFSIMVSSDNALADYISVTKDGEALKISLHPRHTFTDFTLSTKVLEAKVTMPTLSSVRLAGTSQATVRGFKSSNALAIDLSGASSLGIEAVQAGNLKLDVSGNSHINGNISAADIALAISGASGATISGSARDLVLTASGATKTDLLGISLEDANVHLSGASEARINIKGKLDIILADASSFYFQGNPTVGNTVVSGASTIKHL